MNVSTLLQRRAIAVLALAGTVLLGCSLQSQPGPISGGKGCGGGVAGSNRLERIADGTGRLRDVDITLSGAYQPNVPAPVVFVLHGNGGNIAGTRGFGFLDAINDLGDAAIVVIPQGIDWRGYGIGWDETKDGYDMPFFDAMLAYLDTHFCANLRRAFVTGFSWGGDMTNALACVRGDSFRGLGVFAGGETNNPIASCTTRNYPAVRFRYGSSAADGGDGAYSGAQFAAVTAFYRSVLKASATTDLVSPSPCVQYREATQPLVVCANSGLGHAAPSKAEARETWLFWKALP